MTESDWAAPGSAPRLETEQETAVSPPRSAARAPSLEPTRPLSMRPQGLVDLLDAGFAVVRASPALVLGLSAVFVTPLALLSGYLQRDLLDGESFFDVFSDPSVSAANDTQWDATVVSLVGGSLAQTFVAVGIARVVSSWYADTEPDLGNVLGWLLRRSPLILLAWLMAHALQVLGLVALVVGMLVVAVFTIAVAPVLGVEGGGPINALQRSFSLVRSRFWLCLVFFFASGLLGAIVALALSALPTGVGFVIGLDGGWIAVAIGEMVGGMIATAYVGAATVALYLDLRIRSEGLDLELALADAFPAEVRSGE